MHGSFWGVLNKKSSTKDLEPVPGESNQFIAYVAYPIDLFDYGPIDPIIIHIFYQKKIREFLIPKPVMRIFRN